MSASAGIDMALCTCYPSESTCYMCYLLRFSTDKSVVYGGQGDIKGKALGVPVYQLIGGKCREKVRAYGGGATPDWVNCGQPGSKFSSDDLIPMLQKWNADEWAASLPDWSPEPHCPVWGGFTCHKVCYLPATMLAGMPQPIVLNACVDAFAALRRKVGPAVDLAMDLHGRASPAIARALVAKLAPYDPMFIEEPILGDDLEGLLNLQSISTVPIATGERLYTRWQFQDIIAKSAVQIVQPDIITSGEPFQIH